MKCSRKVVVPYSRHWWNIIAAGDDEVEDIGIVDPFPVLGIFPGCSLLFKKQVEH